VTFGSKKYFNVSDMPRNISVSSSTCADASSTAPAAATHESFKSVPRKTGKRLAAAQAPSTHERLCSAIRRSSSARRVPRARAATLLYRPGGGGRGRAARRAPPGMFPSGADCELIFVWSCCAPASAAAPCTAR
jgi:hypothetical protein